MRGSIGVGVVAALLGACGAAGTSPGEEAISTTSTSTSTSMARPSTASTVEPPTGASVEPATLRDDEATSLCASLGMTAREEVSRAAREANEAAVVDLSRGNVEAAEAALAAVVEASPSYRMARFNLACARSRLGRGDDAWALVLPLLCEDLPTFAPRAETDADLATMRASHDVRATTEAVAALYRAEAADGAPLVSTTRGELDARDESGAPLRWEETQAGSYALGTERFLPMGPRQHRRERIGEYGIPAVPLVATRWDAATGRVLTVLATGSSAEDPSLGPVELVVTEAPLGRVLRAHRYREEYGRLVARFAPDGLEFLREDERWTSTVIDASGAHGGRASAPREAMLVVGPSAWRWVERPRLEARGRRVTLPGGRVLDVGSAGRRSRYVVESSSPDVVFVVTESAGECGVPDTFQVERMGVSLGARVMIVEGSGQVAIEEFRGGLFVQQGESLVFYENVATMAGTADDVPRAPIVVRAGIVLTPHGDVTNPGC